MSPAEVVGRLRVLGLLHRHMAQLCIELARVHVTGGERACRWHVCLLAFRAMLDRILERIVRILVLPKSRTC